VVERCGVGGWVCVCLGLGVVRGGWLEGRNRDGEGIKKVEKGKVPAVSL